MLLSRRIEKLEARLPPGPGRLLARLERQAAYALAAADRVLLNEMDSCTSRRRANSPEHQAVLERFGQSFEVLLRDVSDDELNGLIAEVERTSGRPAAGAI